MAEKLSTVKKTAELLDVSPRTLWGWIAERRIEVVRLGRSVRIRQSCIDKLIEQGTTPAK